MIVIGFALETSYFGRKIKNVEKTLKNRLKKHWRRETAEFRYFRTPINRNVRILTFLSFLYTGAQKCQKSVISVLQGTEMSEF